MLIIIKDKVPLIVLLLIIKLKIITPTARMMRFAKNPSGITFFCKYFEIFMIKLLQKEKIKSNFEDYASAVKLNIIKILHQSKEIVYFYQALILIIRLFL